MPKRKITEATLKKVDELRDAAMTAQKAATAARRRDTEATNDYDLKLNALRVKIATGEFTTGDHLLDINIVVNSSVRKDERYEAMVKLEESLLRTEVGELVAQVATPVVGTPQVQKIGLIPESPRLLFRAGGAFGRGRVIGGDSSVQVVIPAVNEQGTVTELLVPQWGGSREEVSLGSNIVFEKALQLMMTLEPNLNLAIALWSKTQLLDRPLVAPERVRGEIMIRREKCVLDLRRKIVGLSAGIKDLAKAQEDPKSWTRSQLEPTGTQVMVSFPEHVSSIKRYRQSLSQEVESAERLGMAGEPVSPIFGEAVKLLEDTKEWRK